MYDIRSVWFPRTGAGQTGGFDGRVTS
jgi:hypothetical protein